MRYAVTAEQMRAMERQAFEAGVPSLLMMERAAEQVLDALSDALGGLAGRRVLFACGPGNNGGDGLAAARLLLQAGGRPIVWLSDDPKTEDARANAAFLRALGVPMRRADAGEGLAEPALDAAVDCLYGTGLSRAPEGAAAAMIRALNGMPCLVIAVDVPSGADAASGRAYDPCVQADVTVALHCHKIGLLTGPARAFAGRIVLKDLGWPGDIVDAAARAQAWPTVAGAEDLADLLPARTPTWHKGDSGRVLVYAGSYGMAGAAAMAARAALAAGAGLVTVTADEAVIPVVQHLAPNATCMPVERAAAAPPAHDVLLAGCGLSQGPAVWPTLMKLYSPDVPAVLDADALNLLAGQNGFRLSARTLITPHPGEAARLLHTDVAAVTRDLPGAARALHERYGAAVLLKSHASVATDGVRMAINAETAPALAKGGSGDMLAGIVAGLMAQKKPAPDLVACAQAASLWMSLAANRAARRGGELSVLSGDVLAALGPVWAQAMRGRRPRCGTRRRGRAGS